MFWDLDSCYNQQWPGSSHHTVAFAGGCTPKLADKVSASWKEILKTSAERSLEKCCITHAFDSTM